MQSNELRIGHKYIPIKKSVWGDLDTSSVWKNAVKNGQNYLYYLGKDEEGHYVFSDALCNLSANRGDFFSPEDVISYENTINQPPTLENV